MLGWWGSKLYGICLQILALPSVRAYNSGCEAIQPMGFAQIAFSNFSYPQNARRIEFYWRTGLKNSCIYNYILMGFE